nr:unnamed protein product [Callosobruchus chinensis]
MNNQALPRNRSFKLLRVNTTENMIWHEQRRIITVGSLGGMRNMLLSALRAIPGCHVTAHILAARMQKAVILGARKYFSPCNLLTLYEGQIRPSLEYCSRIWGAGALTTLSILDAVQKRAIRLIGHPALTEYQTCDDEENEFSILTATEENLIQVPDSSKNDTVAAIGNLLHKVTQEQREACSND